MGLRISEELRLDLLLSPAEVYVELAGPHGRLLTGLLGCDDSRRKGARGGEGSKQSQRFVKKRDNRMVFVKGSQVTRRRLFLFCRGSARGSKHA